MPLIKKLSNKYVELWKEYEEFLKRNKLCMSDDMEVYFVYYDKFINKNCLKYKPTLTKEECSMYNLTVDNDCNWIITDNDYGTLYVKLKNKIIIGFRCSEQCMKSQNYRFLNQWEVTTKNIVNSHYELLKSINFF